MSESFRSEYGSELQSQLAADLPGMISSSFGPFMENASADSSKAPEISGPGAEADASSSKIAGSFYDFMPAFL